MTATWGRETSRGITRAVIATIFAVALMLAVVAPATADSHLPEGETGIIGPIVDADTGSDWIEISEQLWFYQDDDTFRLMIHEGAIPPFEDQEEFEEFLEDEFTLDYEEWECVIVQLNAENNVSGVWYDEGEFAVIATDEDLEECLNGNGEPETETEEEEDHAEPVQRAERVETGAGGTAPGGLGGLALLLGMITVAGATFLRKASETS